MPSSRSASVSRASTPSASEAKVPKEEHNASPNIPVKEEKEDDHSNSKEEVEGGETEIKMELDQETKEGSSKGYRGKFNFDSRHTNSIDSCAIINIFFAVRRSKFAKIKVSMESELSQLKLRHKELDDVLSGNKFTVATRKERGRINEMIAEKTELEEKMSKMQKLLEQNIL